MKTLVIILLSIIVSDSFGQSLSDAVKIFKVIEYDHDGSVVDETLDTINLKKENIDLEFFNTHFNLHYQLPDTLINSKYKNETVFRNNDSGGKDFNWSYSTTYDSLSRVVNFFYSGCLGCNMFAYNYTITYNSVGQIEKISNSINWRRYFNILYNEIGIVKQIDCYSFDKLETKILLTR